MLWLCYQQGKRQLQYSDLSSWCLTCLSQHMCKLSKLSVVEVSSVQQLAFVCVTVNTHIKWGQYVQGLSILSSTCGRCKSGPLDSGAEGCEGEGKGVHVKRTSKYFSCPLRPHSITNIQDPYMFIKTVHTYYKASRWAKTPGGWYNGRYLGANTKARHFFFWSRVRSCCGHLCLQKPYENTLNLFLWQDSKYLPLIATEWHFKVRETEMPNKHHGWQAMAKEITHA